MRLARLLLVLLVITAPAWAYTNYTGYSGAPSRQSCASSCHGSGTGTVTVADFPASYTPGTVYTITISRSSGSSFNFNASCRVGSGSVNAGTLSAGTGSATYNVSGETNGVHFSGGRTSGTFNWTAPPPGTGTVRLYAAAHQGSAGGPNTAIVLVSTELSGLPTAASNPQPFSGETAVAISDLLSWTAGAGAASHDVFFGTANPPDSVTNQTESSFQPATNLEPGTTYYWRINERNETGATTGPLWTFTTLARPTLASNPFPADRDTVAPTGVILAWTGGLGAVTHDVYFGLTNPPELQVADFSHDFWGVPSELLLNDTAYYWRVDERNSSGVTTGNVWRFRTFSDGAEDRLAGMLPSKFQVGPAYPNPFNATITIPFALPQAGPVTAALYDVNGRQVAEIAHGLFAAGSHAVQWSSSGVGSGIYFVRVSSGSHMLTIKAVALK
jgi:hypothetical protein